MRNNAKYQNKVGKNAQKISQNIIGLAQKSEIQNNIAPRVKLIKYSTKLTKLQSLELNNKNKELISKENKDRFTEFNSIKQLEEITVIDMDLVNKLADNNGINDAEMQHEIHYDTELEITLSEAFKMLEKKYGAYIRKDTPTVLCLQETHLSEKSNFLKLKGYTCVESKKKLTKIGSGLLIALKNRSGWSVSELRSEYTWMSCKITSQSTAGQNNELIIINIHMPHITTERKKTKKQIEEYIQKFILKNREKKIILTGDFNMDPKKTMNWINRMGVGLIRTPIYNSKGSRL
ncbi:hypothetical protein BB561_005161 [Smittium simulii]|uniref:Endonuclease/exonuclease/phosphatase domain-containing protein n=1 Tax=Smittium simulii TaxID=133385 RepID=A0A2T9YBR9_9FUNG|nr:hypothetical protein BB561_005161 [Smittium simulii]